MILELLAALSVGVGLMALTYGIAYLVTFALAKFFGEGE